jgi:hypothetical protein
MTGDVQSDQYARATRMIGFALTLRDDPDVWDGLSLVLRARLTRVDRAGLFRAVLASSHPDEVITALSDELPHILVGSPLPVLDVIEDDARWWADLATRPELKAWLAACFVRLSIQDQQQFLASATRRAAA